jgi:hypothetical protein
VGLQITITIMENTMEIPQKTRARTAIRSSDTTPGHLPKERKTGYNRDTCSPMFVAALFTIAKLCKQPRCPTTDEWIIKLWCIYTREYYSATRNQKHKRLMFTVIRRSKDKHTQKQKWAYTNSVVEHVCNTVTTLWNLGKERKEKRMIKQ